MKKSVILKLTIVTISTVVYCLTQYFLFHEEITIRVVTSALACILPITLITKFPKKEE